MSAPGELNPLMFSPPPLMFEVGEREFQSTELLVRIVVSTICLCANRGGVHNPRAQAPGTGVIGPPPMRRQYMSCCEGRRPGSQGVTAREQPGSFKPAMDFSGKPSELALL